MCNETEICSVAKALNTVCDELKLLNKKLDKIESIENRRNEILAEAFVWGWRNESKLDKRERQQRFSELTDHPSFNDKS